MRRLCALAVLAALGAASFASAQQTRVQWVNPNNNQTITVQPNELSLPVTEQFPAGTKYLLMPMVISNILHNGNDALNIVGLANRDSTQVIDTRGYNRAAIFGYFSFTADADPGGSSGDSLGAALFAMQIRHHPTALSDTNNTAPAARSLPLDRAVYASDTIGTFLDYGTLFTNVRRWPLPTERLVVASNLGNGKGVSAGGATANRARLVWSSDRSAGVGTWNGMTRFMSWRIRMIRAYQVNTLADFSTLYNDSTAASQRCRVRFDMVLWNE